MTVSINVNGLSLCHKGSDGRIDNTLPDVCKTPDKGIPVPYKNRAFSKDLVKGTTSCFADGGHMVANFGSEFAVSIFDESGSLGGVVSGTNKAEADWITYSPSVFFEKKPACRLTDKMFMNHRNTVSLAGLSQAELQAFESFLKIVCPKFCKLVERMRAGEKLKPGETWTQKLRGELAEHADELAKLGVKLEKSAVVAAVKGSAEAWGRKAITKFGKSFGARLFTKAIPVIGWAMAAYDVFDAASLVKQGYDLMRVRPDFVVDGKVGDFKFPGDVWHDGQKEAYQALNGGANPHEVTRENCKC